MKRYIVFYLLIFFFNNAFAQSEFKDAFNIVSESDTIFGQIDNKNFQKNSLYCDFRKNEKDTIKRYYPKDLFAYRFINGKYYISKNIEEETIDTSYFFEYLINGELDVYFLQTLKKNTYYISDDGIILNELKYSNEIIEKEGKEMLYKNRQFIGLLDYYTGSFPELKTDIRSIPDPNHKSLIKLSKKFHNLACKDEECIIYEKDIPRKIIFNASIDKTYLLYDNYSFSYYNSNILFQLSQQNERVFIGFGLGIYKLDDKNTPFFLLPLSFNYIHPKQGISPIFSFSFNILPLPIHTTASAGIQYKLDNIAFFVKGGIHIKCFVKPIPAFIGLGFMLDIN